MGVRGLLLKAVWPVAVVLAGGVACMEDTLVVTPDRETGVYEVGETVRWRVEWEGTGAAPPSARYVVKSGGLKEVGRGEVKLDVGGPGSLETRFDEPGTVLVEVEWAEGKKAAGGAVASPERIRPAAEEPKDFDAFWAAKVAELNGVPMNARLTDADGGRPGVEYKKIEMDNVRGTKVRGQIARPTKGEKFPALLIVQWAGVYPLQKPWVTDRAAEGWLALNILPHDLPIDEPAEFYKQQFDGPLKNYWAIGNDDKDRSYYLRMYLSCVRAVEYLKSRPDWDGKTLVVMGTSQGGQQALMTAGLCPDDVTAVLALVPAACDVMGPAVGRKAGFPHWYEQVHGGKDAEKVREAGLYYDPVTFARRIKCPALIGVGLKDDVTPPVGIFALANVMSAPKEVVILARSGHQNENGSQEPFNDRCYRAWLPALREGKAPPVRR